MIRVDSLVHPTLSGDWLSRGRVASFDRLSEALDQASVDFACAVGMHGIGGYRHDLFIENCRRDPRLLPIAGIAPHEMDDPKALSSLAEIGYLGIKIHPRFTGTVHRLDQWRDTFKAAGDLGLTVFYCTYLHGPISSYPKIDPFIALVELLSGAPSTRVVLLHGGDVSLMRYAELVRFNQNLLLDLSMTLMKYAGSSIDSDIDFLMRNFDRRVCVGSDWPEYGVGEVFEKADQHLREVSSEKCRNVMGKNLLEFLGVRAP